MSPQERCLALLPLNTVLFPNASLPLQIVDGRYKLMVQHCLDGDSKLGAVLNKTGSRVGEPAIPYSTGTLAHIVQASSVESGQMFLSVIGQQRFHINRITQHDPYMSAHVELLEDDIEEWVPPTMMEAIREMAARRARLVLGLRGGWVRESRTPSGPVPLSYLIAGVLQIGPPEKQALLEAASASKRLEDEVALLRREVEVLKQRVGLELRRRFSRQ